MAKRASSQPSRARERKECANNPTGLAERLLAQHKRCLAVARGELPGGMWAAKAPVYDYCPGEDSRLIADFGVNLHAAMSDAWAPLWQVAEPVIDHAPDEWDE